MFPNYIYNYDFNNGSWRTVNGHGFSFWCLLWSVYKKLHLVIEFGSVDLKLWLWQKKVQRCFSPLEPSPGLFSAIFTTLPVDGWCFWIPVGQCALVSCFLSRENMLLGRPRSQYSLYGTTGLKKVWSAHRRIPGAALGFDVSLSRYWDFFLRGRERHRAWEYNWSGISLSTGAPGPSVLGTLPTGLATRNVLPRCSDVWPRIKEGRTYSPAASLLRYTLLKLSGVDWMSRHRPRGEMEERRELGRPVLNKEGRKMDWKQRTSSPR